MFSQTQQQDDDFPQDRADAPLLDYRAEEARYPYNLAGSSSGFKFPNLQISDTYRAKLMSAENAVARVSAVLGDEAKAYPRAVLEEIVSRVLQQLLASGVGITKADMQAVVQGKSVTPSDLGLTRRETEVLRILMQGKSNKSIGRELNIAESTVKLHTKSVCRKLNVGRRTEAIVAATRMGLMLDAA